VTFATLKTMIFGKYSFQKLTQLSQGNNVLDAAPSTTHRSLLRDMCFLNLAEYTYLEQIEPISILKVLTSKQFA
jgi:hypothetical protein